MNISAGQLNNIRYNSPKNNIAKRGVMRRPNIYQNQPSFTGDITKILFKKIDGNIVVSNANKFADSIDGILGEKHFREMLQQAGCEIKDDVLTIKNRTFLKDDLGKTILSPFTEFIPAVAKKIYKLFGADVNKSKWLSDSIASKNKDDARNLVLDIVEEFSGRKYGQELDFSRCSSKFNDEVTSNITKVKKNYATRDERTLNRVVTSIVSAFYSASDFFNISMLEKDNKNEAKEAGKDKLKQDFARMGLNGLCTFIALGAFDRYTKRNIVLNSLVIAGSALLAEILSRMIAGNPIKPITPEEAKFIAQARKAKKAQKEEMLKQEQTQQNNNQTIQFKSNIKNTNDVFSSFTNKDGKLTALNQQTIQIANEANNTPQNQTKDNNNKKPKKLGLVKTLGIAFGAATTVFFGMKLLKGDYRALKAQKEFLNEHAKNLGEATEEQIEKLVSELPDDIKKAAKDIVSEHNKTSDKATFLTQFKKLLTKKKVDIDVNELISDLEKLKNSPEGAEIEGLLNKYIENAQNFLEKSAKDGKFQHKTNRFIISGFVDGFTKIFKTIYDILTIPAKGINWIIGKITKNSETEKTFGKIMNEINIKNPKKYKDELGELHQLIQSSKKSNKSNSHLVDTIKKRARNVETSQETGELANISRTMVTAIGTFFFVNDYRNKVLIESEGKNIAGAKAEMNERIWHKVFNFIINGTLMNVFNTTFKNTVNGSLLGAATVATATELTNEALVRKSICQPITPQKSRQAIIDFEEEQINKKGFWGKWSRTFKKITGKKSLTEKTGVKKQEKKPLEEKQALAKQIKTETKAHQG